MPPPSHLLPKLCALVAGGFFLAAAARADETRPLHFENDIVPILSRFSCNASGCHGKAEGQNGFKLSVFGFDPAADHRALTMEGRGRRVFPASPERSLLLLKAGGGMPHGGGVRIPPDRPEYQTLRQWIAQGCPVGAADAPRAVKIEVSPAEREMAMGQSLPLVVRATYSDGQQVDVTRLARFQSNHEGLAAVSEEGVVTVGQTPGIAAVMASFADNVAVFRVLIPRGEKIDPYPAVTEHNFIDKHVYKRLAQLQIVPAEVCSDAEFLRRVYLDLIGTLPTADEARRFLADQRTNRRALLVDELLARPEFADYWALKWADLLRVDRQALGFKPAYDEYRWIRQSLAAGMPLDQFAREIVTASGPLAESPQGHLFRAVPEPGKAASTLSQVFLGVRVECAQCHHHPYDRWGQDDYYALAAYFAPLSRRDSPLGEILVAAGAAEATHPKTGQKIAPRPLGVGQVSNLSNQPAAAADPRTDLAAWMTWPDNPFFARNLANRIWAHLLGRGLVEPVDDVRPTNPPSNPELLDALAADLVQQKFDLRGLIRTICASRVYQHSTRPNPTNERDEQNYSRALLKRLDAEVLLGAVCQTTGVPEKFSGAAYGTRAIELWDSQVEHDFLRLFGRPVRASACECERVVEPSVAQVLHLLNSERVQQKLSHEEGLIASLCRRESDNERLAAELYLTVFSRYPTDGERHTAVGHLQRAKDAAARRAAAEDLAWTMLNSLEFVFNH
jgi:uncharacterized protein DUF1549/uncharacterized protein DUF1553